MDQYFIVAEITFPDGALETWLSSDASPDEPSIAETLETAEGDLLARVAKNHFSIRASLVDQEFFAVAEPLEAAFARAARLGASGRWYAGGYFAGTVGTISAGEKPAKQKVKNAGDPFRAWFAEASAYSDACMKGTVIGATATVGRDRAHGRDEDTERAKDVAEAIECATFSRSAKALSGRAGHSQVSSGSDRYFLSCEPRGLS